MPFVRPLTKFAATPDSTAEIPGLIDDAFRSARRAALGPDVPGLPARLRVHGGRPGHRGACGRRRSVRPTAVRSSARWRCCATPSGPSSWRARTVLGPRRAGAARARRRRCGIPVFLNGLARGCVPADHELFFSRARGDGLKGADVALVIGVPMDFRLGFGGSFGEDTEIIVIDRAEPLRAHPRTVAAELLRGRRRHARRAARARRAGGHQRLGRAPARRGDREARRRGRRTQRRSARPAAPDAPLQGARGGLDRDAIVIGDGGDFVSYAGRVMRHLRARLLAGPGPVRLPGRRPGLRAGGQARAARQAGRAAARRRRVRLQRDGVRHAGAPRRQRRRGDGQQRDLGAGEAPDGVPLRLLGGRRPAPGDRGTTRSSRRSAATASWCRTPQDVKPALERAFEAGVPALVNVLTDPDRLPAALEPGLRSRARPAPRGSRRRSGRSRATSPRRRPGSARRSDPVSGSSS